MKGKTFLYLGILVLLLVAAYFITADRGEKTSSYKLTEKKLFDVDSAKVDKIEIKTSNGVVVLSKATGEWRVDQPYQYRTTSVQIENAVSNLRNLKLESIVSTNPAKKETYGFKDGEQAEVTVYEGGAEKGKFIIGNSAPGAGSSYVKKIDSDNIYIAENVDRNNFVKTNIDDWRDKNIVSIPKESVKSVQFISGSENFTVQRDSAGKYYAGSDSVGKGFDGILNLLVKFDTNGFKDTTLSPETSFDEKIIVDWGPKTEINFLTVDSTKYLVKVSDDKQVYELEKGYAKNLLKTKKEILQ